MSVVSSSGTLSIQLDNRAGLSRFRSIFIYVIAIFGIGFVVVQEKPELILPNLTCDPG